MAYDKDLIAGKLRRWESYLESFHLPAWEEIPDLGLYMEQVTVLLQEYLDYYPPELKEEQFITASTINNYVRIKVMPEPIKRRYYREHIAYLIIILTLKHSLSIALIQKIIPTGLCREEVQRVYTKFAEGHRMSTGYFMDQTRMLAAPILDHEQRGEMVTATPEELIVTNAVLSGFTRLLAEKLLLLDGKSLADGGPVGHQNED